MFWTIAIAFAVIYGLNTILGLRQMKNFASEFRGSSHLRWGLVESSGDQEHA